MTLKELYSNTINPIDNDAIMRVLIYLYSKDHTSFKNNINSLNSDESIVLKKDQDEFYSFVFNMWKKSIADISLFKLNQLQSSKVCDEGFMKLRTLLKKTPTLYTKEQVRSFLGTNYSDKSIDETIKKYNWIKEEQGGYIRVQSKYITDNKIANNMEHALYINVDISAIHEFARIFIKKCSEKSLPFSLKFSSKENRDDSFAIFSSFENIEVYMEIVNEMLVNYPSFSIKINKPSILTSNVGEIFGYDNINGNENSISIKSSIIEESINRVNMDWILEHKNHNTISCGVQTNFLDCLVKLAVDKYKEELQRIYYSVTKRLPKEEVSKSLGYTYNDLLSSEFSKYLFYKVRPDIIPKLNKLCTDGEMDDLVIPVRDGKTITFTKDNYLKIMNTFPIEIAKNDKHFIEHVKEEIRQTCISHNIDPTNIGFSESVGQIIRNQMQNSDIDNNYTKQKLIEIRNELEEGTIFHENPPFERKA